jgi:hypothetical protein
MMDNFNDSLASDIVADLIDPILEENYNADTMLVACWMQLEESLGPKCKEAFWIEVDSAERTLSVGVQDAILAHKLLKPYLPIGSA